MAGSGGNALEWAGQGAVQKQYFFKVSNGRLSAVLDEL